MLGCLLEMPQFDFSNEYVMVAEVANETSRQEGQKAYCDKYCDNVVSVFHSITAPSS